MYREWLFLLLTLLAACDTGRVISNQKQMHQAISQHDRVVILFSQDKCKYCQEFLEAFVLLSKANQSIAVFSKVNYQSTTKTLFEKYEITSTPTVLAFQNGLLLPYTFQPSGSSISQANMFSRWLQRLFQPMERWQDQHSSHLLVVPCINPEVLEFWNDIRRNQLWLDLYCGEEEQLESNLAFVQENGRRVEAWKLDSQDQQYIQNKLRRLVKAYKYKYTLRWNTAIIQEVFKYNVSAFVLLVNNETLSQEAIRTYEGVKRSWYENAHNYEPTIFAVSDLSLNTYETLKLHQYLLAESARFIKGYYYPILAFISQGQRPGKYLLNITAEKSQANIEQFIKDVNEHIIKGKEPAQGDNAIYARLNELEEDQSQSQTATDETVEVEEVTRLKMMEKWQHLMSFSYSKPFLVLINWKNDYRLQSFQHQLQLWWQGNDEQFAPHRKQFDLFFHSLNLLDLPQQPLISLEYVPTLLHINHLKEVRKLEGVTSLPKAKQFIREVYSHQAKNATNQ